MEDIKKKNMEEKLLSKDKRSLTWDSFIEEGKKLGYMAAPLTAVALSVYLINVLTMVMVGHLGELALSSSAIAISLSAVTGFSVLNGMASGLETLCGQAYGAEQYKKLGNQTYGAIFSLILVALGVSIIWVNMEKLLILMGQDPSIAHEAGNFTTWLVPVLFANAVFQPLYRYFQTQSLTMPLLISSVVTISLHIPLCWILVFKSGLKNLGGALAISISNWLNVIFLALYIKFSSSCAKTRVPISLEMFQGLGEFLRLAVPSAVMLCLQWWTYECVILLSGLLPNPQLETSVLSISLSTIATLYCFAYGLGGAVSTRVSNELGAGNPRVARIAVYSVMFITGTVLIVVSGALFLTRGIFGYTFSNEAEVVDSVSTMVPLICLSVILDGSQGVLSGIARGCGWQHIGAYVNLAALYIFGIPGAVILGFWLQLRGRGLWIGIQIGAFLQTMLLFVVTCYTNWEKQSIKARERALQGRPSLENILV